MDNITRGDILNVVGKPIAGTPRTIFIIIIIIVIIIALIGFFIGSGYIQVGNPATPDVTGGNQGTVTKSSTSTNTTTNSTST
jgi:uncharacterized membrane protein YqiK